MTNYFFIVFCCIKTPRFSTSLTGSLMTIKLSHHLLSTAVKLHPTKIYPLSILSTNYMAHIVFFKRPGVAGAVLQIAWSFDQVTNIWFLEIN